MLARRYLSDSTGSEGPPPEGDDPETTQQTPPEGAPPDAQAAPDETPDQQNTVDALPDWAQELIKGLRSENASHRQAKKQAEKDAESAARKAAEEQGKYKELYEKELAKREAAEAEARRLELDALKAKVAAEVGLPPSLATRLQGETEDELKVDAQAVLAALPKTTVNNDATHGTGGAVGSTPAMTPEEIQEFAARFGVDPQYVKPEMFKLKRS